MATEKTDLWSPAARGKERRWMTMGYRKSTEITAVIKWERVAKLRTKQGFQRVAIILPLSEVHHTGLSGASLNAWPVNNAKHGAESWHKTPGTSPQ